MWSKIRFQFLILLAVEGLILPKTANSKVSKSHLRRSIGAVIVFHINDSTSLLTPTTAIVVKPVVTENASSFQNLMSRVKFFMDLGQSQNDRFYRPGLTKAAKMAVLRHSEMQSGKMI